MGSNVEESENSGESEFLIEEDQLQVGGSDGMSDYQSGSEVSDYSGNEQDVQATNADRFMKGRNMYHFRAALKEFAIARGLQLVRIKNEKSRVTAHCEREYTLHQWLME